MRVLEHSHPEKVTFSLPVEKSRTIRNRRKGEVAAVFIAAGCTNGTNVGFINGSKKLEIIPFGTVPDDAIYTGNGVAIDQRTLLLPFGLGRLGLPDNTKHLPVFKKDS